jgi:hypothetical protein
VAFGSHSRRGLPSKNCMLNSRKVLGDQLKRFLIIIGDKSVGRLPNVICLLVFDRKLAEAIVQERYPSEIRTISKRSFRLDSIFQNPPVRSEPRAISADRRHLRLHL